jgi:hypothetical protein
MYRKKGTVEAIQWDETNYRQVEEFVGKKYTVYLHPDNDELCIYRATENDSFRCSGGDWVVRSTTGPTERFYRMSNATFRGVYEPTLPAAGLDGLIMGLHSIAKRANSMLLDVRENENGESK